ncbi:MAG: hypothetical protein E6H55_04015 [Betaproteobacteria bacterium]|nr:MAG: hypothetical protein E6H55_04015 [Betaproteobacteria bacterium]
MRPLALTLVWLALGCSGRDPTQPTLLIDAAVVQTPAAQNIAGHVDGQIIGPSPACGGGLTEVGTFTGLGGGTFIACITAMEQQGNGSLRFELTHTYTTSSGDTFTTTDRVVAAPTSRPAEYLINNQVDITGGTGQLAGASGFLRTHGTVNLQTGVVSVDYHGRLSTP